MAAICSASVVPPISKPLNPNRANPEPSLNFPNVKPFLRPIPSLRSPKTRPTNSASSSSAATAAAAVECDQKENEVSMSIDALQRFIGLNLGNWTGSFYIGFFPNEKAYALRYQTAGMLETVLRQGVLGEDDIGEESPKNLKLPSHRPSIVCENCLYSLEKDMRARAFHIMDPKGIVEMLLIFLEERDCEVLIPSSFDNSKDSTNRIIPYLGKWKGHSITKRSGVYGATIAEADTTAVLKIDDEGQLIQDITSTASGGDATTNVHWTGTMSNNSVKFDGGFQVTLLPGSMYMGCPSDLAKSVAESKSFHLEFCWLESPGKRRRLVRTYEVEGLAVSLTYFLETKL